MVSRYLITLTHVYCCIDCCRAVFPFKLLHNVCFETGRVWHQSGKKTHGYEERRSASFFISMSLWQLDTRNNFADSHLGHQSDFLG